MIETEVFTVPYSRAAWRKILAFVGRWWWAFAIPVAALCFAGLYDWRYAFIAAALVLVCMPGLLAIAYCQCAINADAALGAVPHHIVFDTEGFTLHFHRKEDEPAVKPRRYLYADVKEVDASDPEYIRFCLSGTDIEIPESALPVSLSDIQNLISRIPSCR